MQQTVKNCEVFRRNLYSPSIADGIPCEFPGFDAAFDLPEFRYVAEMVELPPYTLGHLTAEELEEQMRWQYEEAERLEAQAERLQEAAFRAFVVTGFYLIEARKRPEYKRHFIKWATATLKCGKDRVYGLIGMAENSDMANVEHARQYPQGFWAAAPLRKIPPEYLAVYREAGVIKPDMGRTAAKDLAEPYRKKKEGSYDMEVDQEFREIVVMVREKPKAILTPDRTGRKVPLNTVIFSILSDTRAIASH